MYDAPPCASRNRDDEDDACLSHGLCAPLRLPACLWRAVVRVIRTKPRCIQARCDVEVMRRRVEGLGVVPASIRVEGAHQITVELPDTANVQSAQEIVGKTAQLYFYDWEPNVVGPNGTIGPNSGALTGGEEPASVGAGCPSTRRSCARPSAHPSSVPTTLPCSRAAPPRRRTAASTARGTCSTPSTKRCSARTARRSAGQPTPRRNYMPTTIVGRRARS